MKTKILVCIAPLYPVPGNNANLFGKLIGYLTEKYEVRILSAAWGLDRSKLPDRYFGCPVYWETDDRNDYVRKKVYPALSKIYDKTGSSDYVMGMILAHMLSQINNEYRFDVLISTCEPFSMAAATSKIRGCKKILYLMGPPQILHSNGKNAAHGKVIGTVLEHQDAVLTTRFIHSALCEHGYKFKNSKIREVGFPMIDDLTANADVPQFGFDKSKINLLFCGWLYSSIRSPEYFLNIVSHLDERFTVTFMGKECEKILERFNVNTKAQINTLPNQPYKKALSAMREADILINIGNSVPVHIPSKTLEYINTGKPFVNFHKLPDCPTLYYTDRYELCLNMYEGDTVTDDVVERFVQFCEESKGKTVSRDVIVSHFAECTVQNNAKVIIESIKEITGEK